VNADICRRNDLLHRVLVATLGLVLLAGGTVRAAEWVAHEFGNVPYGTWVTAAGADAVGVAHSTGDEIVFFSSISSEWFVHDNQAGIEPIAVLAEGSLALVVGETGAVAFDARTGETAAVTLQGSLLSTSYNTRSFQCGRNLAFLVTDEAMHVFDANLGAWQIALVDVGSGSFFNTRHEAHDDYVVSFLPQPTGDPINLVYSRAQHAFNQTDQGIHAPTYPMDHGYAGYLRRSGTEDNVLVGYCAASNVYDHVTVPELDTVDTTTDSDAEADRLTTYALSWETESGDDYLYHIRAFDTRHDCWLEETLVLGQSLAHVHNNWRRRGEICCRTARDGVYYIYDGREHALNIVDLGLTSSAYDLVGGRVMVAHEGSTAVGFCPPCTINVRPDLQYTTWHECCFGQDFINFSHHDDAQEMMSLYWYNATTNRWTATVTGFINTDGSNTAHVFALSSAAPQREAVFYSSYLDTLRKVDLTGWPMATAGAGGHFGYFYNNSEERGLLFDAHRGTCHEQNGKLYPRGRICLATQEAAGLVHGYSVNTGAWSSFEISGASLGVWGRDLVGMLREGNTNVYHAFDGSDGTWATLETSGYYETCNAGERTAYVVTSWFAYALGTGVMVAVEPDPQEAEMLVAPLVSALTTVYPNPCNPRADIAFELAERQPVRLCLHDLRGRRVRVLVDDVLPHGAHRCVWDGRDDGGRGVASGTYVVRFTTADRIDSRKILLVR
jgi:hypothetical protein